MCAFFQFFPNLPKNYKPPLFFHFLNAPGAFASRAAHFARALPAAVCKPGVAAVEGAAGGLEGAREEPLHPQMTTPPASRTPPFGQFQVYINII